MTRSFLSVKGMACETNTHTRTLVYWFIFNLMAVSLLVEITCKHELMHAEMYFLQFAD